MNKVLYYTLLDEDLADTAGGLVNLVLQKKVRVTGHEISAAKFTPDGITCDGVTVRVTQRMQPGQTLRVVLPEERNEQKLIPTQGPVRVLYEDEDLIAVDKAAGEVVHPGPGHYTDTVANYVTWYLQNQAAGTGQRALFPDLSSPDQDQAKYESPAMNLDESAVQPLAGSGLRIIGRLDKETSGVLLYAKNRAAAARLQRQRREGILVRTYLAVCDGLFSGERAVWGALRCGCTESREDWDGRNGEEASDVTGRKGGTIDLPLEKIPGVLMKMQVAQSGGLHAVTHYEVLKEWEMNADPDDLLQVDTARHDRRKRYSLLRVTIDTGRTHQIRVHMASIGHPLVGDTLYGTQAAAQIHVKSMPDMGQDRVGPRALLHAREVRLNQPFRGKEIRIVSPLPEDIREFLVTSPPCGKIW